jgi:hypothetical protein
MRSRTNLWLVIALVATLGVWLGRATPAAAKGGWICAKADAKFLLTGKGDRDGDGLNECRERLLHCSDQIVDTDGDGLGDGAEVRRHCDPMNPDSDGDGIPDGQDLTPCPKVVKQEIEAILDALTCSQPGVAGSISALGTTAIVDPTTTRFDDVSCEQLAALLGMGKTVFVEIEIFEDMFGVLTATKVEAERDFGNHHDDDEDDD